MSTPDEFLQIDTPENVVFDYEVAGIGSRFLAGLVDGILVVLIEVLVYLIAIAAIRIALRDLSVLEDSLGWVVAVLGLTSFVLLWGYYIVFEILWNGQSPGKRMVKLRVIRNNGMPITLTESLIRNFMRLIDFLPISFGLAFITMFIDRQSRRLGDLAAGTLVVFDRAGQTLESVKPSPPGTGRLAPLSQPSPVSEIAAPVLPVERLTDRDIVMVEEYLQRRSQLAGRATLAAQIVESLHKRMEIPFAPMDTPQLERWLSDVLKAYRSRQR